VRDNASGKVLVKVHHSRVIRFSGRKLPFWEEQAEIHWGASELEHVFDELAKRDNTSWNIAALVFQANLLINKVDGMDQMLAMGDAESQRQFYSIKSAQNQMRNNNGMMIIGTTEDVQSIQYTFSGLNDIYESFMLDVAGASEIPVTRLFGRAPAGMNATGESDLQNYYDMISQEQNTVMLPKIEKLYPVIFMSEFGAVPTDLGFKFNPVRTPSDEQIADLVAKKVSAIGDMYDRGLITQRCAVTELHELSFTTNMFTAISNQNIEDADDTYSNAGEMGGMGMEGLGGSFPPGAEGNANPPPGTAGQPLPVPPVKQGMDGWEEGRHPRQADGKFGAGEGIVRQPKSAYKTA
jgi:phage-related protein (TIGR01555 family)